MCDCHSVSAAERCLCPVQPEADRRLRRDAGHYDKNLEKCGGR